MKELFEIQQNLNAPKNLRNEYGNYNYRSLEGILEAVKPLLNEYKLILVITDAVANIGSKNYVEATSILYRTDGTIMAQSKGYAREADSQKGMMASQLTGATSSYARKYSLNGLFAIDDNKDADCGSGRNYTEEASKCKTLDELKKWYLALNKEQQIEAAGVVNERKEELTEKPKKGEKK